MSKSNVIVKTDASVEKEYDILEEHYHSRKNWNDFKAYAKRNHAFESFTEIDFESKPEDERWFSSIANSNRLNEFDIRVPISMLGGKMECYVLKNDK